MLKILYAGSPDVAALPLSQLIESGICTVVGVLTNPAAPIGRSKTPIPTPVAQAAYEAQLKINTQIPILTPEKLDAQCREQISALKPDLLICFAYGKIFGPKFMNLFPLGGINVHPSLLPLYRGAAPIPAAILNRDQKTGITIQRICPKMDAGNILLQTEFALSGTETTGSLLERVKNDAGTLIIDVLRAMENGTLTERKQDETLATYCTTIANEDAKINWSENAFAIDAKIRAYNPKPGAFTAVNGAVLHIHEASPYNGDFPASGLQVANAEKICAGTVLGIDKQKGILIQTGKGILAVANLQWQAKKAMSWKDFINGTRNFAGSVCT